MEQHWAQKHEEVRALVLHCRYAEVEPLTQTLLAQEQQYLGREHLETLKTLHLHAMAQCCRPLQGLRRHAEAESIMREELQIRQRVQGPEHADTLNCVDNLSRCLMNLGKAVEAEPMIRWVLNINQRVLGTEHALTLAAQTSLGMCLMRLGRCEEAALELEGALTAKRRVVTEAWSTIDAMLLADIMENLADCYSKLESYTETEDLLRDVVEIFVSADLPVHATIDKRWALATCLFKHASDVQRGLDAPNIMVAELMFEHVLELNRAHPIHRQRQTLAALLGLAECQIALGKIYVAVGDVDRGGTAKLAEAEALLQSALGPTVVALGEDHITTFSILRLLADCLLATGQRGKRKQAMKLRARADAIQRNPNSQWCTGS